MTAEYPVWSGAGMLFLALSAALLGCERQRRLAGAGLLILGLALAAWRAGAPPEAGLISPARLGQGFVIGNGGLLTLGTVLVSIAALQAGPGPERHLVRLLAAAGVALLGPVLAGFLGTTGPVRSLGAALGLGLTGVALAAGLNAFARTPAGIVARRLAPLPLAAGRTASLGYPSLVILAAAVAATALGPHLAVVFLGLSAAAWAGYVVFHPRGQRPLPVAPVLTLLLVPAYGLLATVTGPIGLRTEALPQVPLSPAAELLLSPALLLAGWAVAGLWPLQRQLPGAFLAPVGALLLSRIAFPLAPEGLEYWRPLTAPLVILGIWNAAAYGRWALVAAGAGFLAVAGGAVGGVTPAAWLLGTGFALELAARAAVAPLVTGVVRVAAWPLATWAGIGMLETGLRGEVVYSALGTLGLALLTCALIPPRGGSILPTDTR